MFSQEEKKALKDALEDAANSLDCEELCKQYAEENVEDKYANAYHLYQRGKYRRAKKIFLHLVMLQPLQKKFWVGLAACRQLEKSYREALVAWSMVALLDDADPLPHFHAAECYAVMEQKKEGLKALRASIKRTEKRDPLLSKIKLLQESLEDGKYCSY